MSIPFNGLLFAVGHAQMFVSFAPSCPPGDTQTQTISFGRFLPGNVRVILTPNFRGSANGEFQPLL
jgi:hypothetical protein